MQKNSRYKFQITDDIPKNNINFSTDQWKLSNTITKNVSQKDCKIWTKTFLYNKTPYVQLQLYPSPESFTQPLITIVVTFSKSGQGAGGLPKDSQSDIKGQGLPKELLLLDSQNIPSVITLKKNFSLPIGRA